jgi:hypothetical protein
VKRDSIAIIAAVVFVASIMLSAVLIELAKATNDGPNVLPPTGSGFFYDESSVVTGTGQVSIRSSFADRAADSDGWMKGNGSINFESLRSMNKIGRMVDFTQKSDLVFQGGQLKNKKNLASPLFDKGIGASVNVRFDLSHVDKSETEMVRSINRFDNTLSYDTAVAFDGSWAIKTMQGWSIAMNKSSQRYAGSFQIQKNIEFDDSGKR